MRAGLIAVPLVIAAVAACGRPTVEPAQTTVHPGVRLVYMVVPTETSIERGRSASEDRKALVAAIDQWMGRDGGKIDGTVDVRGSDQVVIELFDETVIDSLKEVFQTRPTVKVYHAKNLTTSKRMKKYELAAEETVDGGPVMTFVRTVGDKETIRPGDPEYSMIIEQWGEPLVDSGDFAGAEVYEDSNGRLMPLFRFTANGAQSMTQWSRAMSDQGEYIAIVIDGRVVSAAPLRVGTILSDSAFIDGNFEPSRIRTLVRQLEIAALDVRVSFVSEEKFGKDVDAPSMLASPSGGSK